MWIINNGLWNESHNILSKYFVERMVQRVDSKELITNRHRTTSGYTLIFEIVDLCEILVRNPKSINRLISIVEEAVSKSLSSNIANDTVIRKYFSDVYNFYSKYSSDLKGQATYENLNELTKDRVKLNSLLKRSQIILKRIESVYFDKLIREANQIDLSNIEEFRREAQKIDKLIDILIPYLIFNGYSATTIFDYTSKDLVKSVEGNFLDKFIQRFSFRPLLYDFRISIPKDSPEGRFYEFVIRENEFITNQYLRNQVNQVVISEISIIDPASYITKLFIQGIKEFVIKEKNFEYVEFSKFFEEVKWKLHDAPQLQAYSNTISRHKIDAVSIKSRENTFEKTIKSIKGEQFQKLELIEDLNESLYYYNLGLNTSSLENSFALLWTSLESLIPYRFYKNDIQNIQYFVSKILSIGACSRDIASLALRIITYNSVNRGSLNSLGTSTFQHLSTKEGLFDWFKWIVKNVEEDEDDPYDILNPESPLLCSMYCNLNELWNREDLSHFVERIGRSKEAISYQLDRMYLFRNQIVHSGAFIHEYTNLWGHLEWYVGKVLSYLYLELESKKEGINHINIEDSFLALEAKIDQTQNFLLSNKNNKIMDHIEDLDSLCQYPWMAI